MAFFNYIIEGENMKKGIIVSILLGLLTVGCSVSQYHAKDYQGNGYSEYRMAADRFIVTYRGDRFTDPEDVQRYALRRAAEVASNYGYRFFLVENNRDLSRTSIVQEINEEQSFVEDFFTDRIKPIKKTKMRQTEKNNFAIELTIRCYNSDPKQDEAIDAYQFLAYNPTSNIS